MRIVVLDGYTLNPGDNPWDALGRLGELVVYDRTSDDELVERVRDAEILVINKRTLPAAVFDGGAPRLVFVAITATGYNLVDLGAAERRGVVVSNVPEYGTQTVAQFTMALLLELCHHVGAHWRSVAAGDWARCPDFGYWLTPQIELAGKTMGIVGAGRIGRQVASLARAFGMQVLAAGRPGGAVSAEPFDRACPIEQLFEASDVVSLHCPLAPDTEGLVERSRLARMKREALLINTSRGGLVVERDLAEALNSGALAGAAVDVVSVEPIREDNPLLSARNCLITPHMAWASREARRRLLAATVANVEAFLAGTPKNVVSRKLLDSAHRAT